MAEAFGIAAGAVGFVSLLVQITSGINKLRAITNSAEAAPDEIQSVMRELDFLVHVMQEANDKAPSQIDPLLQHCQTSCDQVVRDLDALNKILETGSKRNAKGKVSRILAFRHWKENVEDLRRDIQGAKLNLIIFALSQLGIRWATVVQFYIVTTSGRYSLRPSIEVERVMPYTSPGFEILWKLRNRMISFEDGREELIHLRRTDPTFPDHVDPSGKSYIENLLMAPARSPVGREYQYQLLELFMGEFEMTRGTETPTFLSNCAHWIGEAPHLELLEILLDLGFNAAEIDIHHWPEPCSPDWFAPDIAADPFFVEYLRLLWFAEMSPLHEAVLFDSLESVRKWTSRLKKDERNAFGQTPLHLAISKSDYLRILIDAGYDLDAGDNYGITPLMYAAATNQEEAVMMLIEADSDLNATDFKWNRNFMFYAGLRQHWNLILQVLNTIESHVGKHAAERWAQFATYLFLVIFPDRLEISGVSLNQLLAKCGTVNFIYNAGDDKRNRCLLHDIRSPAEFDALLANGFRLVNHADSAGQHPVMAAADRCESGLVNRLLAYGTDINRKDNFHKTSLYYVLRRLEVSFTHHSLFRALETLRILLENDSNVLTRDACRCPCSPQGCLPTATLQHGSQGPWRTCVPLWSLEWLSLVSEYRGESEAKITLLSFIRRAKHGEMGMTHVCCQREQSYLFQNVSVKALHDENIEEIIDEESAFIEDLESEMDQSARKEYNALLNDWIVQIKTSLDTACIRAAKQGEEYNVLRPNCKVDHHHDTFVYEIETCGWRDPKREVTSQISDLSLDLSCTYTGKRYKLYHGSFCEYRLVLQNGVIVLAPHDLETPLSGTDLRYSSSTPTQPTISHESLNAALTGLRTSDVIQFRGIPYGRIPRRFAAPEKLQKYPRFLDCTNFGPRCPQVAVDVGHLLRIPPDHTFPDEPEDEFRCTNLDVMLPDRGPDVINSNLPVLVWIHDMSKIVADSMRLGKPIIAVSVQYRLNVFALGNGEGPPNLALRDQELALEWVQEHIAGFGGDPDMVTLAGESAGAIYCHAHLVANARVRQVILSSGSLFLSPPQPWHLVASFRDKVSTNLKDMDQTLDLETASVSEVVEAVRRSGLQSFFLEWEDPFNAWHTKTGCAERLLLSDVTKEGAIYQAGVWATEPSDIAKAFDASEQYGDELKKLYHIYPGRPSSCKTGALDFINDYKYLLPVQRLEKSFKDARKPVFRCLIDEANPWQPSSGAHHAVDLVLLFGGFDLSFSPSAERVGQAMREAWVKFISGEEPWPEATEKYYGFGPHGSLKTLEDWEVQSRRRIGLAEKLSEMESPFLDKTSRGLAAGKDNYLVTTI
ncbi:hypothetical protein FOXB_16545 [Fusarium oxysporum f. sp. conglutinans Fo5176]|uniref:Carboxylesterase type B domain-containing protein n=1 Tax=Fusarium oxysporum (strain Fo5176) TaxID=660025 RepID=F9GD11_FUSOF|nr:hypothetical protein FOXB_16545 [Fusarium oxysporum f. sp. conglutinans Fo5176]